MKCVNSNWRYCKLISIVSTRAPRADVISMIAVPPVVGQVGNRSGPKPAKCTGKNVYLYKGKFWSYCSSYNIS